MLEFAERAGRWLENLLLGALLLGMVSLAFAQVLLRDLGYGSLVWGDEAVRLMVLWIAMIAGIAAAREDRHISIDVLSRFLPPRGKALAALIADLFTAVLCAAIAWYGWQMVAFALEGDDVLLGNYPAWWFQAVIPVAFMLMAWRYLLLVARRAVEIVSGGKA